MIIYKILLYIILTILLQCITAINTEIQSSNNINKIDENTDNDDESQCQYVIKKFRVPIDHFNFLNNHTFQIRYIVDDRWQKKENAPIFFYSGNEGNIENFAKNTGFLWEIAPIFNALIIYAEHRYYGESLPYGNRTYSDTKNLQYLGTQQALLDYIDLIKFLKTDENLKYSPVITFGGSYGGQLASWMRIKYPHVVHGAIASSAPIFQFSNVTDCHSFTRIITSIFRDANPICPKVVRQSWDAITNLTSSASGKRWIFIMWNLCRPLKSYSDVQKLKEWLINIYVTLAMSNYPYPVDFPRPLPAFPITHFCKHFTRTNLTNERLLMIFKKAIDVYGNFTGESPCFSVTDVTPNLDAIGWDYQTCTEMILPVCSDGINDMFEPQPWDLDDHTYYCQKRYKVTPDPNIICKQYGCSDFQSMTNIVFSNGLLDPWSAGGVLKDLTRSAIAMVIPTASHQLDLRSANSHDPNGILRARDIHRNLITKWIKDYNEYVKKTYQSN